MFKKKYTKSEWFEGFLWAESVLRPYYDKHKHLFTEHTDGLGGYIILGRGRVQDAPHQIKTVSLEYGTGVIDYIENSSVRQE